MKKIITDSPDGNTELMHNRVFVKDGYVWLRRMGEHGEDIDLIDYCKKQCCLHNSGCDAITEQYDGAESFGELMMDCDCIIAHLYWLAVGFAEVRQRLMKYENGEYYTNYRKEIKNE